MAAPDDTPPGVMTSRYGKRRAEKPFLKYRLLARAREAVDAFNRFDRGANKRPEVLDIGAAEGRGLSEFHRLVGAKSSVGVEYAAELVALGAEMPEGVRLVEGNAEDLTFIADDNSKDVVTALAVLEHCENVEAVLSEANRVLKPGGLFIASCPSGAWDRIADAARLDEGDHHVMEINQSNMVALFQRCNFQNVEYRRFMSVPVAALPYLGLSLPVSIGVGADNALRAMRVFPWLFVNQLFVGRKPQIDEGRT